MGQDRSHKAHLVSLYDRNGREIFHVFIPEQIWIIFNIDPHKASVRVLHGELIEFGLILFAGVAPGCAKTQHELSVVYSESLGECGSMR